MKQNFAFTLEEKGRLNVLKTPCGVSEAFDPKTKQGSYPPKRDYIAIWDTGATGTVITAKVASDLGLQPIGYATSHHAGGVSKVPSYLVNIYLPNGITIPGVRVIEATLTGNFEMLIGMDIISHGDFSFTNVDGKSCFSFRIPSIKKIDYVEEDRLAKAKQNQKPSWMKTSRGYKGGKKRR